MFYYNIKAISLIEKYINHGKIIVKKRKLYL